MTRQGASSSPDSDLPIDCSKDRGISVAVSAEIFVEVSLRHELLDDLVDPEFVVFLKQPQVLVGRDLVPDNIDGDQAHLRMYNINGEESGTH